jgi:hypothetical protein
MSDEERAWLHRASGATSVETVLKEGEVLYIPRCVRFRLRRLTSPIFSRTAVYSLSLCFCALHVSFSHPSWLSHWFHYIISLQKSAQCNVRSVRKPRRRPRRLASTEKGC